MIIEYASFEIDYLYLTENEKEISPDTIRKKIDQHEILVVRENGRTVGWLRFGYFWDLLPIMNMLWIAESHRGKGIGTQLVSFWENEMHKQGHHQVMTTTLSNEQAKHFYRKLAYQDAGALLLPNEALEIILIKDILM